MVNREIVNCFASKSVQKSAQSYMGLDEIISEKPSVLIVREFFKKMVKKLDTDEDDMMGKEEDVVDEKGERNIFNKY